MPGKVGLSKSCTLLGQVLYLLSFSKSFTYWKEKIYKLWEDDTLNRKCNWIEKKKLI
jgi:hypothetical protein